MEPNTQTNIETPKTKSNGALIGSIIIIIILIIGGIYLAQNKIKEAKEQELLEQNLPADNLSTSDELSDIEQDLINNADINALEQGLE
ncbi:MAG: hypothetical protein WC662_04680 [Candidatus Paceibacterota bacterium]|jgi:hypothetical protein